MTVMQTNINVHSFLSGNLQPLCFLKYSQGQQMRLLTVMPLEEAVAILKTLFSRKCTNLINTLDKEGTIG